MFARKRCTTPQTHLTQDQSQHVFEETAYFRSETNKENKALMNFVTSRKTRRIHIDNPVMRIARPAQKEKFFFPAKPLPTEPEDAITGQNSGITNPKVAISRPSPIPITLLEREHSHNRNRLNPKSLERPESTPFGTFGMQDSNPFNLKIDGQARQKCEEDMFNFTFSPTKKPVQKSEDDLSPQSNPLEDNFNLDSQGDDVKDQAFPFSWYKDRKASLSPKKITKVKASSIIADNDSHTPPVIRPVRGRPKAYSDFKQAYPSKLEPIVDANNLKYNAFLKNSGRNASAQRQRPTNKIEYRQLSPLLCARERSLGERSYAQNESPVSPLLSREDRRKLPTIILTKRGESREQRASPNPFKLKSIEGSIMNSANMPYESESFIRFGEKIAIKPMFDDNFRAAQKSEPVCNSLESQRSGNTRFRAEEIILRKIFKPMP